MRGRYVKILGQKYEAIYRNHNETEKSDYLSEVDGYMEPFSKKLVVKEEFNNYLDTCERLDLYKKQLMRHEIVHAFLEESGIANNSPWGRDEMLVDWLAFQIPKMAKVMNKLEVLV